MIRYGKTAILILTGVSLGVAAPASADPATHRFKVTSAKTFKADCGPQGCDDACVMHVALVPIGTGKAPRLQLSFLAVAANDPLPGRRILFDFSAGDQQETVAHLLSVKCKGLKLTKPKILCTDSPSECSRFTKITIEPHKAPDITAEKVEVQ